MKSPAFQFYPAEFLADENVVMMSNQELGCYIKLMCYCWREGSIPSDISKIAKLCGEDSSVMAKLWIAISSCFEQPLYSHDRLVHPRLEKERIKQLEHKKERAESGKKGAESRWNKDLQKNGSAIKQPIAKDGSSSSSSSLSSSSIDIIVPKRKTKTSLPNNFEPSKEHQEFASQHQLSIVDELKGFRLHHEAQLTTSGSWNASFSTWLRNAVKWRKPVAGVVNNQTVAKVDYKCEIEGCGKLANVKTSKGHRCAGHIAK